MKDINEILKIINKVNEDLDVHQSYYEKTKKHYKKVRRGSGKTICYYNEKELRKNYAHIEKLAYHDSLTGLYNRVAFLKYAYNIFL